MKKMILFAVFFLAGAVVVPAQSAGDSVAAGTQEPEGPALEEFGSEDGNVVLKVYNDLLEGTGVKIYFYNEAGELIGQWKHDGLPIDQYKFPNKNGKYWVIQMCPHDYSGEKKRKRVFVLDSSGKEMGKFETYAEVSGLPLQDTYFLLREGGVIRAHDLTGEIKWERKLSKGAEYQTESKISPNGKYIVILEGKDSVILLDRSGKELFKKKIHIENNKLGWSALFAKDVNNEGEISLVPTGNENRVIVLDRFGKIRLEKKVEFEAYHVIFSSEAVNTLIVESREGKREIVRVEGQEK